MTPGGRGGPPILGARLSRSLTPRPKRPRRPARPLLAAFAAALGVLAGLASPPPAAAGKALLPATLSAPAPKPQADGCDRYAAPWGSNGNRGTKKLPYKSPQRLANALRPGQTGCLRGGRYEAPGEEYVLDVRRGGVRLRSYPRERALLYGIVIVRDGANDVRLSRLDFEGPGTMNTIKVHGADTVIEDSTITNLGRGLSCMILGDNGRWGAAVRTIIRRNRFHDCGNLANGTLDHAIYAQNLVDGRILSNVFWRTAAYAIHLYPNAQRTRVAYNVIDGDAPSVRGGIIVSGDERYASSSNVVELNVVAYAAAVNIESWWAAAVGSDNLVRRNCVWAAKRENISSHGLTATDNVVADPRFVRREARDYRLAESSPCRSLLGRDPASLFRR